MVSQLIFIFLTTIAIYLFSKNVKKIRRNILLGKTINRSDRTTDRWLTMLKIAFGQTKMAMRPIPAFLHFIVYAGFIIINIEVLEIIIDGIFGTHRIFASYLSVMYNFLIRAFEFLAIGVLISCIIFLIRRNIIKIKRFSGTEMTSWPRSDANYILSIEILLMTAFLIMNAADLKLQLLNSLHYNKAGSFPISHFIINILPSSETSLITIERFCWWLHIVGILAFMNYLPYSKHLHIVMAFPNTYYSNLELKGKFNNMVSVTNEVKAMLDPSYTPTTNTNPERFGAKDVRDLTWKQLMDAYSCTECGRCTSMCPANQTGKLLSPRKIMMDTRDRLTEVGKQIDQHGRDYEDGKSLIDHYITREELWACTSCNACTEACPVNIDPLSIIMDMRRYLVMEESAAPSSLNAMQTNIETNGAPWKFAASDRINWINN